MRNLWNLWNLSTPQINQKSLKSLFVTLPCFNLMLINFGGFSLMFHPQIYLCSKNEFTMFSWPDGDLLLNVVLQGLFSCCLWRWGDLQEQTRCNLDSVSATFLPRAKTWSGPELKFLQQFGSLPLLASCWVFYFWNPLGAFYLSICVAFEPDGN